MVGMTISQQEYNYFHGFFPRTDLIELVPKGARRILDVGCGVGKTGQLLREKGFEEIFGVEININAAQEAKAYYQEVIIGDIEKDILPFNRGFFDCILYGDVLEHLIDPWKVLKSHREILKDDGIIICSIPNIRYYKILKPLILNGRWEYVDLGILDRTHLRFFTLKTIEDMFRETGYEIKKLIKKKRCSKTMKLINRLVFNELIDFLVLQYRIIGVKTGRIPSKTLEDGVR
jgi:2-polyprenyl-3-methyl-5-hydroxy-6-metoxy-1,4-benzoquinol methylase